MQRCCIKEMTHDMFFLLLIYCNSSIIDVTVAIRFQLFQISFTHQAAKQHNAVARGRIAGALLAFFCQGIGKKSCPFHSSHSTIIYCNRCGQVMFAVGRLSAIRYKKANWLSACSAGYIMGKLCEFQRYHLAISRAKKAIHRQIMT